MNTNFGYKFRTNWPKSGQKLGFLLFSQVWFIGFHFRRGEGGGGQVRFERQTCQFLQILKAITC